MDCDYWIPADSEPHLHSLALSLQRTMDRQEAEILSLHRARTTDFVVRRRLERQRNVAIIVAGVCLAATVIPAIVSWVS